MTLSTESGEETPLESLSMSSVAGLNSSRDMSVGRLFTIGSAFLDPRTIGNGGLLLILPDGIPLFSISLICRILSFRLRSADLESKVSVLDLFVSFGLYCGISGNSATVCNVIFG